MIIETLRQFRIFNYAVFDFAVTFIGVCLLSPLLIKATKQLGYQTTKSTWLYLAVPLSIPIHMLFQTYTPLVQHTLDYTGYFPEKIIILILTFLGIKTIKKINK